MKKLHTKTKKVHGAGINDSDCVTQRYVKIGGKSTRVWACPYYGSWAEMLRRCYSDRYIKSNPTYAGCSVCEEWLTFSAFKSWAELQEWEGKQLDKDIVSPGNKVYSPDACAFVSLQVNSLLNIKRASRGDFPIGVSSVGLKYVARCRAGGGDRIYLGAHDTLEKASWAYGNFKAARIREVALTQEPRVQEGLNRWADLYEKGLVK